MRLFIAAEISSQCRHDISRWILDFKKSVSFSKQNALENWRWTPLENLHITLKFLGPTPPDCLPILLEKINQLSQNTALFEIHPQGLQYFPNIKRPQVLVLGMQKNRALQDLAQKVDSLCEEIGFKKEIRPYHPHITLARTRGRKAGSKILGQGASANGMGNGCFDSRSSIINELSLIESKTLPEGSVYQRIKTFLLSSTQ